MEHLIPADFLGTPIHIIDRDGQKWLTADQAGRCLGYDPSNARKGVLKIYERHGDEFNEMDVAVVNLTTPSSAADGRGGGRQTTRIFSATGCIKLGFFANTTRAKDFRAWASKALAGQAGAVVAVVAAPTQQLALAQEIGTLRDKLEVQNSMIMGLYHQLAGAQKGHIRAVTQLLTQQKRDRQRESKARLLQMAADGYSHDDIALATGKTKNNVKQYVFQAKRDGVMPKASGQLSFGFEGGAA